MSGSLRHAAAPIGAAAGAATSAAAAATGRWATGGAPGDSLLRAAASGLRQLHDAAWARVQGGDSELLGAGAPRGYASQPAEAEAPGNGGGNGGSGRPKPRFLLERLGLAGNGSGMGAGRGGGAPSGPHRPNGHPGPRAPGSGPAPARNGGAAPGRPFFERDGRDGRGRQWQPRGQEGHSQDGRAQQGGGWQRPPREQHGGRDQQGGGWQRQPREQHGGRDQQGGGWQRQPREQQGGRDQQGGGWQRQPREQQGGRDQQGGGWQRQPGEQHGGRDQGGRQERQPREHAGGRQERPQREWEARPQRPAVQAPAWLQRERERERGEGDHAPPRWARDARQQQDGAAPPRRARQGDSDDEAYGRVRFGAPTEFPTTFPGARQQQQRWQGPEGGDRRGKKGAAAAARKPAAPEPEGPPEVVIPEDVTVLKLAQLLGAPPERVEQVLKELGEEVGSRQDLVAPDSAELAALEFGKIAVLSGRGGRGAPLDADAVPRPAVVTVMGHVDHGKTTLLDALRKTSVAAGEAGGITQHIGAFEVQMPGSQASLTFLDTPGHAAFTSMRARGAAVTDLVVLVVAADDGIMPQTREAISHARAAGCPMVVAITKCDTERADAARVRQQLIAAGLELEEVGGNIQVVEVAAVTGMGLDELEEALLLQAEMMELKASCTRRAEAVVIEARVDRGQGPVATVVVKRGTLKVGQPMVVGTEWGRVRALKGTGGKAVTAVLPGQPAEISGLKGVPQAGDQLLVVDSEERAQVISRARTSNAELHRRAAVARMLSEQAAREAGPDGAGADGEPRQKTLPVIIKADVQGSAEAVRDAVQHMCTEQIRVQVVHVGVGPISLSDIQLAAPLGAKVLGFNVRPAGADVEALAKQQYVEMRCQRVIYGLLEDVGDLLVGSSPKVETEVVVGSAEVLQTFQLKGSRGKDAGLVAGCRVSEGSIKGSLRYRVVRDGQVVHTGPCASLKRHKLEVETVGKGTECGVLLEDFDDIRPGDTLQCISIEMKAAATVNSGEENKWIL